MSKNSIDKTYLDRTCQHSSKMDENNNTYLQAKKWSLGRFPLYFFDLMKV